MDLSANVERFKGFADKYERFRPSPPELLASVLTRYARVSIPGMVVDLGCGTGLSTRYWSDKAVRVVGIDPSADMLRQARAADNALNIRYQEGFSNQTGLPEACAQVVTASQALHWMDPQPTFVEVARILQPGGVFAAYDYDWPPVTFDGELESAYEPFNKRIEDELNKLEGPRAKRWEKHEHLKRMRDSGCFKYIREILLHSSDTGSAERLIGLLYSQGSVQSLLKLGYSNRELGLDEISERIRKRMGDNPQTWYWCTRVRMGLV